MKTAFCDTLKNCQFQYVSIPQKSLDLFECTLQFLINMLHVYLFSISLPLQHALIRNNTFINFQEFLLPTYLFRTKI